MQLRALSVGPIIGETTPTRVRIWGRSEANLLNQLPMRSFGAVRVRKAAKGRRRAGAWLSPRVFKMNPNFDMTGIGIVDRLQTQTAYDYQIGHFFSDGEIADARFSEQDWHDCNHGTFTTASDDPKAARTIVVGSCRYLLKTFLGDFFDDRGDKTFRSVLRQITDDDVPIHQLLMMGDQIYADDLNVFNPDKTVGQFFARYRTAFEQPHLRKLMSQVPTYMTLDDHEIEDNWPANATDQDLKTLFPVAIHAFQAYQLSHSPNIPIRAGRLSGTPNHLWYDYQDGCTDVFVTDSRTERFLGRDDEFDDSKREMFNSTQMRALKRWLANDSKRVKLVVTSVPFFPDSNGNEGDDKWAGFVSQRQELLEHIERKQIQPVVFLSGDVHASLSAELHSPSGLRIYSVISSAFFWPYPHPSAHQFKLSGSIDGGRAGTFQIRNASRVISDDNLTRLNVQAKKMEIEVFERKGGRKMRKTIEF